MLSDSDEALNRKSDVTPNNEILAVNESCNIKLNTSRGFYL